MITPGERIKNRRAELGLSQGALARMVGMAQSTLSEIERGDTKLPSADNLLRMSKALGVTQAWIVTGREGEVEVLTPDEERLFSQLRKMSDTKRAALLSMIEKFSTD
jgi:transcriptional regulator with XRE-family HTH domain